MTKDMQELKSQRDNAMKMLNDLKNNGKLGTDEFKAQITAIDKIDAEIADLENFENRAKDDIVTDKAVSTKKDGFKTMVDVALNRVRNAAESLVQGGTHGENLLIPEDVRLEINEAKKQWKSARILCTEIETIGITGSFNFDEAPSKGLVAFNDGDDIDNQVAPKFTKKTFTISYKGAILPVSNLLQDNERAGLMVYLNNWFVRRAVISENTDIFKAAKDNYNGGTPKDIADWKALKESINVDLDPAVLEGGNFVIVTNQDGFNALDKALDTNGRPILQPDPANPTRKLFMGYPIEVFSNAMLPTAETKVPIVH